MANSYRYKIVLLISLIAFPFTALFIADVLNNLVPLLFHQIYYLPVAWIGEPFFYIDSDLGTWPRPAGRAIAAVAYAAIFIFGIWAARFFTSRPGR